MLKPLTIYSVDKTQDIPALTWDRLANPDEASFSPFLTHAFFHALEESGSACQATGWHPFHLVAEDEEGNICGILPLYLKSHSQGEYVFDHGWAQGLEMAGGRYYPKMLSAIPFTPVTSRRVFAAKPDQQQITKQLIETAVKQVELRGLSSLHCNFIEQPLAPLLEPLGFLLRRDTQFHWQDQNYKDFEGFLACLQSRKRKALRKERKAALKDGLEVKWIEGDEIKAKHWDAFFSFYMDTGARKWGTPYLTRTFFDMIDATLKQHVVFIFAYQDGVPIAGALNFKGGSTLYGRYWGALQHHPFLHFEICYYQAIDYALAHGLTRVEAGAQGEHKLLRGYAPCETYSAHYISHPGLKRAVAQFLEEEGSYVNLRNDVLHDHLPFKKTQNPSCNE